METVVKVIIIMNRCNDYGNCHCSIFVDPLHSYFASYSIAQATSMHKNIYELGDPLKIACIGEIHRF